METKPITLPAEDQVTRVLNLFARVTDPFQRGVVVGKLEAYVEQSDPVTDNAEKSA